MEGLSVLLLFVMLFFNLQTSWVMRERGFCYEVTPLPRVTGPS